MSTRRCAALAVGGAVLVAVVVVGAGAWVAVAHGDRLLRAVGGRLGRDVDVAHVGLGVAGGLGVRLAALRVADDPAIEAREPFVTADALAMRLRLLPLLRGQVVVDRVELDAPVVNLVRTRDGRLNVETLGRGSTPASEEAEPAGERTRRRPAFQLANLRLRHGTFRYHERATNRTVELDDVAVDARQPRLDSPVPVAVRARLAAPDLRLDDIRSDGVVELTRERPAFRGTMRAGRGAVGTLPLGALEAHVMASPPVVDVERFSAELLNGSARGKARLAGAGEDAGLAASVDAKALDLSELPAHPHRPRPAGSLALAGNVTGPPPGAPHFARDLAGQGRFDVADGRVENVAVGRAVLDVLSPFLGAAGVDRLRVRYPDLFASDDLRFTRLAGSGRLAGGRIHSNDLTLASASYAARGEGSLGLDGTLDVALRLSASRALTDDLLGRSRARGALVDADGRLTVPLRVRGALRRPRVTPAPEFAAGAARALLKDTGLGDVAGEALERLFRGKGKRRR